jgi:hypothetical protein
VFTPAGEQRVNISPRGEVHTGGPGVKLRMALWAIQLFGAIVSSDPIFIVFFSRGEIKSFRDGQRSAASFFVSQKESCSGRKVVIFMSEKKFAFFYFSTASNYDTDEQGADSTKLGLSPNLRQQQKTKLCGHSEIPNFLSVMHRRKKCQLLFSFNVFFWKTGPRRHSLTAFHPG